MNQSTASFNVGRTLRTAGAHPARGRLQQQQQQQVPPVRRQQQQQGSTDFQPVSQEGGGDTPPARRPTPSHKPEKPAAKDGGHGGTPVGRLKNGTDTPGETKSYIDEASMNVDA